MYAEWVKIFEHFQKDAEKEPEKPEREDEKAEVKVESKPAKPADDDDDDEDEDGKKGALSRKKYKLLHRLSIAELKQLVRRPDVVEVSARGSGGCRIQRGVQVESR